FRFRHTDGRDVWTLMSASPIHDDEGRFAGALAMVTDITARRAAEEALRASQATNVALLDVIPDLVFRMDRDGRYLDYAGPQDARGESPLACRATSAGGVQRAPR